MGNEALNVKDYDAAIARYDEAIKFAPTHPGIVAVLTNQSQAYRLRGADRYNSAVKFTDAAAKEKAMAAAVSDFKAALSAAQRALDALANVPRTSARWDESKSLALGQRFEAMMIAMQRISPAPALADVRAAFVEYLPTVPESARRLIVKRRGANLLFDAGIFDEALVELKDVLKQSPNDVDSLFMAGMSAAALNNSAEGAQFLKRYLEIAPATHLHRADATAALEYLK